jgi:hypothetical protein
MDERRRRSDRVVVIGGVTAMLVGFALLSDGFTAFRVEPRPQTSGPAAQLHATLNGLEERLRVAERARRWMSQVDEPIVSTTEP